MAQVTLYLDAETDARMKAAARAAGVSISQWVARLIREQTRTDWPETVRELAGAWSDFPTLEKLRSPRVPDSRREPI